MMNKLEFKMLRDLLGTSTGSFNTQHSFRERLCFTERHSLVLDLKLARECEYSPSIDSGPGIAYQIFSFLVSMYVCVCAFMSTCVPGACGYLRNSEEGVGSPGTA